MSQVSGGSPKVTGMTNRLRQLDAAHHIDGETAWSTASPAKLLSPGANCPVLRHAFSSVVRLVSTGVDAWSQLIPEIGTTTIEQSVSELHPSDSFSTSERTSNCAEPVPSAPVKAAISAGGNAESAEASGGIVPMLQAG